ncbi:MAG: odh 1 [Microvirga sp.]|jgi:opine dehydrogenase|nr:odh 1 [Microvirga sp.]
MRVAIMGAGAIAFGSAAFLSANGHTAVLWSPSGKRTEALARGEALISEGKVEGQFHPKIAVTCAHAVADADAILLALPANGHKVVMDAMAPHLTTAQVVIISSHASLGALYLAKKLAERELSVPIVAWSTTVLRARQRSLTSVKIATLRGKVDLATLPVSENERGLATCVALFGDRFVQRSDILAIALSNVNPQSHMALALSNFTRMERGEDWGQTENMTDAVGRLLEAIDKERLAIASRFGLTVRTMREHYSLTYGVPDAPIGETARLLLTRTERTAGPATIDTRYVLEDVPFGLLQNLLLGRIMGTDVSLHEAGLNVFSALYGRDLAKDNDLLPAVGLADLPRETLMSLVREGWSLQKP